MRSNLRVLLCVVLVGCGSSDISDSSYEGGDDGAGAGSGGGGSSGGGSSGGSGTQVEPGQLTAGEWDDAANLGWYEHMLDTQFAPMIDAAVLPLDQRMITTITDSLGQPIAGATIAIDGTANSLITGRGWPRAALTRL